MTLFKAYGELIGSLYSHLSCETVFVLSTLLTIIAVTLVTERIQALEAWNDGGVITYL
jgi:heme/copper-type cytochrome/quinol oxidase subunit 4